jgi:hypothetical protein
MIKFSASEAALEGFRLTRERPGTIFGWGIVFAVCIFVIGRLMLLSVDPQLVELSRHKDIQQQDIEQISALLAQSWPAFIFVVVLVVGLYSTLIGGIYRLVLRPGEKGFLHLRLGMDELRLTGVNLLLFAFGMICLTAELAAVAAAEQGVGAAAVASVVLLVASVWVGVRLALATPMTFAERRIAIRDSWRVTRGKFWPLLGMIVLAAIFYVIVWLLISIIGAALVGLAGGADAVQDVAKLSGTGIVLAALVLFLQLILQVIQVVMIYAPFAVAYQQVHGDPAASPLSVQPQDR